MGLISFLGCIDLTIVNTAAPRIQSELGPRSRSCSSSSTCSSSRCRCSWWPWDGWPTPTAAAVSSTSARSSSAWPPSVPGPPRHRLAHRLPVPPGRRRSGAVHLHRGHRAERLPRRTARTRHGRPVRRQRLRAGRRPLLGGVLVSAAGWRWVFWINVPLVVLALALCAFTVRESRDETAADRLDWPGLLLSSLGIPAVVLVFTLGGTWGWTSPATLGLIAFAAMALSAFAAVERRSGQPLLHLGLFRDRAFLAAIISDFALACFYTTVLFLVPLYLSVVRELDGYATGLSCCHVRP
ncbi:MFS transporter [Streptomyces sp. M19]